jgi:putative heme-binding domain-containing protein
MIKRLIWFFLASGCWLMTPSCLPAQMLEAELQRLHLTELVANARMQGDAARGAILFHQPYMACAKCHVAGSNEATALLGPDLSALGNEVSDESLVESVLYPSKVIRPGFESLLVLTTEGRTISGLLAERTADALVLRDAARDGERIRISNEDIEEVKQNELSIMPAGQVNQLNSQQQFFDLMRYLIEIRDGGVDRARELRPSPALLTFTIPEYENRIDHSGLIQSWNRESYERGEAIYKRVCANCHGTHEQPGSLPTSLRFADGQFKNGSDPFSMYRTLTHGFGQMAPQTWMVPSQKYDVIHYLCEAYLKPHNPAQFKEIDSTYLANLPAGDTFGPEPNNIEVWSAMDYGPSLIHTYEIPGAKENFAYKGIAVRLDPGAGGVARGHHWLMFDTDTLRVAAGWSADDQSPSGSTNFIDWHGIQFDGEHGVHPRIVGQVAFANATGPGWANPGDGTFTDNQRVLGRDGKRYGPLPHDWGRFKGIFHHDQRVILSYSVGNTDVLESPSLWARDKAAPLMIRTFNIGPRDRDLILQIAESPESDARLTKISSPDHSVVKVARPDSPAVVANDQTTPATAGPMIAGFTPGNLKADWIFEDGKLRLKIPAGQELLRFSVWLPSSTSNTKLPSDKGEKMDWALPPFADAEIDLTEFTKGGAPRWPQMLTTQAVVGSQDGGPFAVDILTAPESNPWLAQLRFTGLDFFTDGRIAVCTWDGDVWVVTPGQELNHTLNWQRVASGLFQPLGLKVVNEKIHLICRDQLTVLHDLNGDGEIDFYECLNNDHQVTEHFHEFAMGLQTDRLGNFYYAKSGCHGKAAVVPHHGTLLRVSADGSQTDILANGFRAANGVCLNPDGSFVVTDQEGYWNPKNRINWVTVSDSGRPNFYGNMLGYHDVTDTADAAMVPPLCWITNDFDRSPAELLWVESETWGPLQGSLLNLSYGYGKVFLVPHEHVNGQVQGGMIELPLPTFPTGVMRGRFHPDDGQLYLCGMFAWAGNATYPGGLYRVRYSGESIGVATHLKAYTWGIELGFAEEIDQTSAEAVENYSIQAWDLKRTAKYGSEHYNQRSWPVQSAHLSPDRKTVRLMIPQITPTWGMEIVYELKASEGKPLRGKIHNTIHQLREASQ